VTKILEELSIQEMPSITQFRILYLPVYLKI